MKQLILHGSVIFFVGLLCGVPFGRAIVRRKAEATISAWRVAHTSLTNGGILLLVLGLLVPHLQLGTSALTLMVWAFVASAYGFVLALPLGAHYGHRGLTYKPPLVNRIVFFTNMVGVLGSVVGSVVLLWGAYAAL